MTVVKEYRQIIPNRWIDQNRRFEKLFLHISGQVGPKLKGRLPQ
jgi:hypothetical protein